MQDDVTMAIKNLRDALAEISMDAGRAQKREDRGEGTLRDNDIIEWVEELEEDTNGILVLLKKLERNAGNYDDFKEVK